MITYSAIEVDSPSFLIVLRISEESKIGIKKEQLENELSDKMLILPRLNDLIIDKMAIIHNGRYRLTSKGIIIARLFIFYRNLIKTGKGG